MTTKLQPYQGSYLTPSLEKATVADAMRTGVMSCEPDLPATTVARMMATHHIHAVVVEGIHHDRVHGERLTWGVVSDMDLLRAARAGIEELTVGRDRRHRAGHRRALAGAGGCAAPDGGARDRPPHRRRWRPSGGDPLHPGHRRRPGLGPRLSRRGAAPCRAGRRRAAPCGGARRRYVPAAMTPTRSSVETTPTGKPSPSTATTWPARLSATSDAASSSVASNADRREPHARHLAGRRNGLAAQGAGDQVHVGDEGPTAVAGDHHPVGAALDERGGDVGQRGRRRAGDDAGVHDVGHGVGVQPADAERRARRRGAQGPRRARLVAGEHRGDVEGREHAARRSFAALADENMGGLFGDHAPGHGLQRVVRYDGRRLAGEGLGGARRAGQHAADDVARRDQAAAPRDRRRRRAPGGRT